MVNTNGLYNDMNMKQIITKSIGLLIVGLVLNYVEAGATRPKPNTEVERSCKKLVVINSYHESAPWVQGFVTPFMMEAAKRKDLTCQLVHLNSSLIRNDSVFERTENGLFQRFSNNKPDYLVLVGDIAFAMRDRIKQEWGDIPMILLATNDELIGRQNLYSGEYSGASTATYTSLSDIRREYNFTFVEVPELYKQTIDMMHTMQPWMRKLVFASDDLANNVRMNKLIKDYLAVKYHGLEYEWVVASQDNSEMLQQLITSKDMTIGVLLSSFNYIRQSVFGYPMLVTDDIRLVASTQRPVFTLKEAYMDYGAVGGFFPDRDMVLNKILGLFYQMLAGVDMRTLPFVYSDSNHPKVDYQQLREAGLDESDCPEDTMFVNKPENVLEHYFWYIIIGVVLLLSVIAMMVLYIVLQRRRIAMMASHQRMVNNMPICYLLAKVKRDISHVTDIHFVFANIAAETLVAKNASNGVRDQLFDERYIFKSVEMLYNTDKNARFTYYFDKTETYYEFIVCRTLNDYELEFFGIDITEKVMSENSLKETTQKLEMTLGIARIVPWRWNFAKRKITYESDTPLGHIYLKENKDSTYETHVIDEDEFFNVIYPDDREHVRQVCREVYNGEKKSVKGEFRVLSVIDGNEYIDWLEINASIRQYGDDAKPELLVGSLLVITERKKQEAALIAAREAAAESDRLKSAFLANMSHDIRTPLNAIVGFSNLLAVTDDQQERQEFINIIESNNEQLLTLIGDIIDFSKVEANVLDFSYRPTDINELICGLKKTMQVRMKEGVVLNCMLGAAECCAEADPARLSQVLTNFLTNAIKFTDKGNITFGYEINDGELYFFVRDTGKGLSKTDQARVFQRFVKLNKFVPGTGLGLPICKSIIEKQGGKIGVESKGEGHGCTFWFTIPYKKI